MTSSFLSQAEIEVLLSRLNSAGKGGEELPGEPVPEPEAALPGATAHNAEGKQGSTRREVERVSFPDLQEARTAGKNSMELFYDTPVTLVLELGTAELKVGEVLALQKNSIIKLDRLAGENVTMLVNGCPLASGEVVVINENFGFRVTAVGFPGREKAEKE
jgi:flagellar motor switch protein FliN/FliY